MAISEARLNANRANAARSTGPVTEEGKANSRRNALKHGLSGTGVVLLEGDQLEIETRVEALHDELQPNTDMGSRLIRKIATSSLRSERAVDRENSAIARRVRNSLVAFDEQRLQRVDDLFAALSQDNPRGALRNLRRMPEGVDRLIEAWKDLRHKVDYQDRTTWDYSELVKALQLMGLRAKDNPRTRIGDVSYAIGGQFRNLTENDGPGLSDRDRRQWAREAMLVLMDGEIAELEAHRSTLDLEGLEQDRCDAPILATFDDSKEGILARRYEAQADRDFYKALKEFRQVEAEAETKARNEATAAAQVPAGPEEKVVASPGTNPPRERERSLSKLAEAMDIYEQIVRESTGASLSITRPPSGPV